MKPLDGIKVVEAASYISGPFATMTLADLGAVVTKVEPAGKGDPYRRFGARYGDSSLFFKATNQNKQSVFLDLKSDGGMHAFRGLLEDADVFITNWRPGVAENFGLDAESIRRDFPRLIWVRISGYGQTGPYADMPAYDTIVQARSGLGRSSGGEPATVTMLLADKVSAMTAAQTAMAALVQRDRTGEGAVCDLAMIDALAYFLAPDVTPGHRLVGQETDHRIVGQITAVRPLKTADSWIVLSPVSGKQFNSSLKAVDRLDAWDDLISHAGTTEMFEQYAKVMEPELAKRTTAEWEEAMRTADVPAAAVLTIDEHLADPQIAHNGVYETVDEPNAGPFLRARYPSLFNGRRAAPSGTASPSLPTD